MVEPLQYFFRSLFSHAVKRRPIKCTAHLKGGLPMSSPLHLLSRSLIALANSTPQSKLRYTPPSKAILNRREVTYGVLQFLWRDIRSFRQVLP